MAKHFPTHDTFLPILLSFILLGVWMSQSDAQSDTENIPDVTGVWVGIIDWHKNGETSGEVGTVNVYRIHIAQAETNLVATHLMDGQDELFTHPVERFDEPFQYGFEGTQHGDSITFGSVPIFYGHCRITIKLHHGIINSESILVGAWQPYFPPRPTPEHTSELGAPIVDEATGCGTPPGGSIVLRRFEGLLNVIED